MMRKSGMSAGAGLFSAFFWPISVLLISCGGVEGHLPQSDSGCADVPEGSPDANEGEDGRESQSEKPDAGIQVAQKVTIYQLQNPLDPMHPKPGTPVLLKDVIAVSRAVPLPGREGTLAFFAEEKGRGAYSGVMIAGSTSAVGEAVAEGDVLEIIGVYREELGEGETRPNSIIDLRSMRLMFRGDKLDPVVVKDPYSISSGGTGSLQYQGVLVSVVGVSAASSCDAGGWWTVTGGLFVGDMFVSRTSEKNEVFASLTGVLHTAGNESVLEPRAESDFVVVEKRPGGADGGRDGGRSDGSADTGFVVTDSGPFPDASADETDGSAGVDVFWDAGTDGGNSRDCSSPAGHVVISQISSRGPNGGNDEIVEIHNPTAGEVDISGWRLEIASVNQSDGGMSVQWYVRATVPETPPTVMEPGGFFLFANKSAQYGYTGDDFDLKYTTGMTDSGGARVGPPDGNTADTVGFSAGAAEGDALRNPCPSSGPCSAVMVRKAFADSDSASMSPSGPDRPFGNGYDTDDNLSDFVVADQRAPRNSKSGAAQPVCR